MGQGPPLPPLAAKGGQFPETLRFDSGGRLVYCDAGG